MSLFEDPHQAYTMAMAAVALYVTARKYVRR
jgi:hypothetical protein